MEKLKLHCIPSTKQEVDESPRLIWHCPRRARASVKFTLCSIKLVAPMKSSATHSNTIHYIRTITGYGKSDDFVTFRGNYFVHVFWLQVLVLYVLFI